MASEGDLWMVWVALVVIVVALDWLRGQFHRKG